MNANSVVRAPVPVAAAEPRGQAGFWALIATQFQGAFSDNVLKNLVIFMMLGAGLTVAEKHRLGELVGALFSLPFILFSMAGGFLADRHSKRAIMVGVKIFEVMIMLVALAGFYLANLPVLLACVFLMGTHSAFFGPSKYGVLPELLPKRRLSWGNGILELGTFLAIILGTVTAALLAEHFRGRHLWSGALLVGLALVGLTTSWGITRVPAAAPDKTFHLNCLKELWRSLQVARADRPLQLALVGNTYFFFLGALLQLNLFYFGAEVLEVSETKIGLLNVALAIGIGLGSVTAGYLSGNKIEYGLVPLGALGMAATCLALLVKSLQLPGVMALLAGLGFFGGFFIVPVTALLQHRPPARQRGELLAAANLLSFVGVFAASGAHYLLTGWLPFSPREIFFAGGILTLISAGLSFWLLPDALLRFVLWLATHSLYRIKVLGRKNIPGKGGALLVCNHLSLVDAVLLQAAVDRPIRFLMLKSLYEKRFIGWWARATGAIPISSELRPRAMIQSLQTARTAIENGEVVCIFAEGQITRIGQMLPFRRGFERIMKGLDAPIIPVGLDGVWGSIFSFERHHFLWKLPQRIPYPVTINFGRTLPSSATPFVVRQTVQELLATAWQQRLRRTRPLHHQFVVTARRHPRRLAMVDATHPALTFHGALVRAILLARRCRKIWSGQTLVGMLLPPSIGGALANWAALFCGKVPVNLNYTLSAETLAACVRRCEMSTILTSRAFWEKVSFTLPAKILFLEDIIGREARPVTLGEKMVALVLARCVPVRWLARWLADTGAAAAQTTATTSKVDPTDPLDRLASVIFSSGSTGDPKGVMLSHYNLSSNIQQLGQTFAFRRGDIVLGVLPFFHSFGFTGTLLLPGVLGIGAVYHANPLDAKTIGGLVLEHRVTFLLATPTFLQIYLRGCTAEQFGSVRLVAVGAEKLPERLALAFEDQFGVRPFEAYGCTECSPAVTVNTLDYRAAGFRQVGAKRGKIGHPLPGVCVRIVDPTRPDPSAALPLGQSGLLLVRGPNVMQGYLRQPEKTAAVVRNGWYVTGDIAVLDEDGFLQITDRWSRFSKIGGEMVPHIKIEEKLHELAGTTQQTFVVTSVTDEKKGERLVVLHQLPAARMQEVLAKLAASDLPNLWKPKAEAFFHVPAFPLLGSGKLDLRKVREQAVELAARDQLREGE
ncbi:MAG: Bifunctional protein Aas [Verrucomicrobia bacterium ADurb.Bin118]|jgi:acyl-[acyl-carrier-protein]-phospholipid O-acyltransferase/long-chain-fatty-acid--[acyl-carrier-protein] ligase|nr:MAG: Bifunctional protein Aas [Verrucomicrobia bacterium ADurb.Bin118]